MIHCSNCEYLINKDEDGMVVTCILTGQRCFIDDLPLTTMSRCPKTEKEE